MCVCVCGKAGKHKINYRHPPLSPLLHFHSSRALSSEVEMEILRKAKFKAFYYAKVFQEVFSSSPLFEMIAREESSMQREACSEHQTASEISKAL